MNDVPAGTCRYFFRCWWRSNSLADQPGFWERKRPASCYGNGPISSYFYPISSQEHCADMTFTSVPIDRGSQWLLSEPDFTSERPIGRETDNRSPFLATKKRF